MNNEPVAWIKQGRLGYPVLEFEKPFRYESYAIQNSPIPLYIHPVNPKYDPETGEPLIDGYPLFSGLPHPIKKLDEDFDAICLENKRLQAEIDKLRQNYVDLAVAHQNTLLELKFGVKNECK